MMVEIIRPPFPRGSSWYAERWDWKATGASLCSIFSILTLLMQQSNPKLLERLSQQACVVSRAALERSGASLEQGHVRTFAPGEAAGGLLGSVPEEPRMLCGPNRSHVAKGCRLGCSLASQPSVSPAALGLTRGAGPSPPHISNCWATGCGDRQPNSTKRVAPEWGKGCLGGPNAVSSRAKCSPDCLHCCAKPLRSSTARRRGP